MARTANTNKITEKSTIRVFNNSLGSASFKDFNGRRYSFPRPKSFVDVELSIIVNLYNECPNFIDGGTIIFEDMRVYDYLGITEDVYSKIIPLDKINEFLSKGAEEIEEELATMPKQVQENVAVKAKESGIDSNKKINAIKNATGFDVSTDEE